MAAVGGHAAAVGGCPLLAYWGRPVAHGRSLSLSVDAQTCLKLGHPDLWLRQESVHARLVTDDIDEAADLADRYVAKSNPPGAAEPRSSTWTLPAA